MFLFSSTHLLALLHALVLEITNRVGRKFSSSPDCEIASFKMITFLYVWFFLNSEFQRKMRLLRKDDMCLVSSKSASPRTPTVLQKEPGKFQASSSVRKVLSVVADSTGRNYSV